MNGIWHRTFTGILLGVVIGLAVTGGPAKAGDTPTTQVTCTETANTALSTTSETVFADSSGRRVKWCIVNEDASIAIRVKQGATATATSIRLAAGSTYCDNADGGFVYTGVIDAIAASGTPSISAFQCTR